MIGKAVPLAKTPWLIFFLFWLSNLAFLVYFADRDGYEGDDLNSILPMAHLAAAKQGMLLLYRYGWQPLSYELGTACWSLFGTPTAVFLMSGVSGACTLALLLWWLWREGQPRPNALVHAVIALLGIPELWYSSLYYNSTMPGMPLLAGALLLARGGGRLVAPLLAGVLTGLAIMMRMDFVLICPLLAVAAWPRSKGILRPMLVAAGVVATLLVGFSLGLLDLPEIIRIQAASVGEIREKAYMPGWDFRAKVTVASISLSPAGWLMLLGGSVLTLTNTARQRDWRALAWLAAAAPATYPLLNLLSPKYALPLAPFLLLLFAHGLGLLDEWLAGATRRWAQAGLCVVALVPVFISISIFGHAPFLAPGLAPVRPVGTHDGPRGYGGYVWQMIETDGPGSRSDDQKAADQLAGALLDGHGENIVFLGGESYFDPGSVGWRHLQLILERRGIHGQLVGRNMLRFDLGAGQWLILARSLPANVAGQPYRLIDKRSSGDARS